MRAWTQPDIPALPGTAPIPHVHDTASGGKTRLSVTDVASIYVCGITPYDATHIGHANTYLAFDTLNRLLRDAGLRVEYAQNTTDVDDPLLERADATGRDWRELAEEQTDLFRRDMEALGIVPPDFYIPVTTRIDEIAASVAELERNGIAYRVDGDVYFDNAAAQAASPWVLGEESHLDRATMLALSAERGGDPERPGKRDPLDPLLWRAERPGEPSWASPVGPGRPGWHIECSVLAQLVLDVPLTVKGGAQDLIFPHHEFSAGHSAALSGSPLSCAYVHAGLVGYRGEKMSKSLGNLVFVRTLLDGGTDPRALRLALLAHHYRESWEWTDADLERAEARLAVWSAVGGSAAEGGDELLNRLRVVLGDDLDTPGALALIDERVATGTALTQLERDAVDALLGIRLDRSPVE
jgi:L-cysteine:1D-myo-inositol 2-amino-2-deoxy-alpha-D-glucopyranoside ligase